MKNTTFTREFFLTSILLSALILANYYKDSLAVRFSLPEYAIPVFSIFAALLIIFTDWLSKRESEHIKNEFITIVTHKFRTPLTAIKWISSALKKNITSEEKDDLLKELDGTSQKISEIVDLLVDFAKFDKNLEYAYKATSLRNLVYGALDRFAKPIREKGITFTIDPMQDIPLIVIDEMKIQFVIDTLFDNAIRYTPSGGTIKVAVREHDKSLNLYVEDSGVGVKSSELSRIGNRFYRSAAAKKIDTEGLGLGLHVSKKIIERHKGKLLIKSRGENKGAMFTVQIPKH